MAIYMENEGSLAILENVNGFDWDEANVSKNWQRYNVTHLECEAIFFNEPLIIISDEAHSNVEDRYYALRKTDLDRFLFVVFTIRGDKIRVISARDMSRKERKYYP